MEVTGYRDLLAWQKAMDLVVAIYRVSAGFPREELFGLTAQIRRAAISIPSNIAEGQGRRTTRDFLHFLTIANGSLKEIETQIIIAQRLSYIDANSQKELFAQISELGRLLGGLIKSLRIKSTDQSDH